MAAPPDIKSKLREYEAFLEKKPNAPNAVFNYAYFLARDGQFEAAIEHYRKAIRLGVSAPEEAHLNIANICMDQLHDHEAAARHYREARSLNPHYAPVYHNLGNLAEQMGDREKAVRYFKKCLELEPRDERALARLADTRRFENPDDPLLYRMRDAALTSADADLHFSLGRAYEQLENFGLAWQYFTRANRLDEKSFPPYRPDATARMFEAIASTCSKDWLAGFGEMSQPSVFICGLFRTGSTLLERILGAHPSFTAGGESEFFPRLLARHLPDYPAGLSNLAPATTAAWRGEHEKLVGRLAADGTRLTDKRPDNFLYAGMIGAVLPSARFIVTERDWRDTALSIYGTRLGPRQNYATRIEHIRHYIGLQRKLVDHWQSILGDRLMRLRYEDLVARPRETLEGLLTWLGEAWSGQCLSFHEQGGAVKTASVWQVREPLHSKSVGRWRTFEEAAGNLFADTD